MYKQFLSDDISFAINKVYSTTTLNGKSGGVKSIAFYSASISESSQISESYHESINTLFYKNIHHGGNATFTSKGTLYPYSHDNINPQYKDKFYDKGVLFSISESYSREGIKPGTFSLTDESTGSVNIVDDGYGNLYASNASIYTDGGVTSISSSKNYVGNVFYEHGIAIITDTGSFSSGCHYTSSGVNYTMSFSSTVNIYSYDYSCTMNPNKYNQTSNRTILNDTSSITNYYEDQSLPVDMYQTQWSPANLQYFGVIPVIPGYQVSRSVVNLSNDAISPKFNDSTFRPYITKIGLFNEDSEMIMIASLSQPIKKIVEHPMTFNVQIDF